MRGREGEYLPAALSLMQRKSHRNASYASALQSP